MVKNSSFNISVAGVSIKVTRKKVKHLRLVAYPSSGEVRISSPEHIREEEIRKFAKSKAAWIYKHLNNPKTIQRAKESSFENNSIHYIWGNPFRLVVSEGEKYEVTVNNRNEILMTVKHSENLEKRELLMREWYRRSIKTNIPGLIEKWEPVMNVKVHDWGVKKMKTRWGTCNIRAKRIWLNLMLAKRNPDVLEYILVHEMTHILERLHSRRFYRLMDMYLPGWRMLDRELGGKHWSKH